MSNIKVGYTHLIIDTSVSCAELPITIKMHGQRVIKCSMDIW